MKTPQKIINRSRRRKKIRAKIFGTALRPRLVVYRSLSHNYAQLIDDSAHKTLVSASDLKIKGVKSKNAKKIGLDIAKLALGKNINACVFDRNAYKYHGRVKALAEGAREGGLKF